MDCSEDSDQSGSSCGGPSRRYKASRQTPIMRNHQRVRTLNRWTVEEHERLAYLVGKWGSEKNWATVAEELPGRTGKQCRERWLNHMKPGIVKGNWSPEEEFLLAQCHAIVGSHWSKMTRRLPGRTENSIKNFWNATLRCKAPSKKRGILWTYIQLHDPATEDNTTSLMIAVSRLQATRELPGCLLGQLDAQLLDPQTWRQVHKAERDYLENNRNDLHLLAVQHPVWNTTLPSVQTAAANEPPSYSLSHNSYAEDAVPNIDVTMTGVSLMDGAASSQGRGGAGFCGFQYQPEQHAANLTSSQLSAAHTQQPHIYNAAQVALMTAARASSNKHQGFELMPPLAVSAAAHTAAAIGPSGAWPDKALTANSHMGIAAAVWGGCSTSLADRHGSDDLVTTDVASAPTQCTYPGGSMPPCTQQDHGSGGSEHVCLDPTTRIDQQRVSNSYLEPGSQLPNWSSYHSQQAGQLQQHAGFQAVLQAGAAETGSMQQGRSNPNGQHEVAVPVTRAICQPASNGSGVHVVHSLAGTVAPSTVRGKGSGRNHRVCLDLGDPCSSDEGSIAGEGTTAPLNPQWQLPQRLSSRASNAIVTQQHRLSEQQDATGRAGCATGCHPATWQQTVTGSAAPAGQPRIHSANGQHCTMQWHSSPAVPAPAAAQGDLAGPAMQQVPHQVVASDWQASARQSEAFSALPALCNIHQEQHQQLHINTAHVSVSNFCEGLPTPEGLQALHLLPPGSSQLPQKPRANVRVSIPGQGLDALATMLTSPLGSSWGVAMAQPTWPGKRVSYSHISLQTPTGGDMQWDWESLVGPDSVLTGTRIVASQHGAISPSAGTMSLVPTPRPWVVHKQERPSLTSVEDDAVVLIDTQLQYQQRRVSASEIGAIYSVGSAWSAHW